MSSTSTESTVSNTCTLNPSISNISNISIPPPGKKKKISEVKRGPVNDSAQARIKYTNACIQNLTDSLPHQTFSQLFPVHYISSDTAHCTIDKYNTNSTTNDSNQSSRRSSLHIQSSPRSNNGNGNNNNNNNEQLQVTPRIFEREQSLFSITTHLHLKDTLYHQFPIHPNITVSCVFCSTPIYNVEHYFIQPHSRMRYSPMCASCAALES